MTEKQFLDGNVKVQCTDPDILIPRMYMSGIVPVSALPAEYDDQRVQYLHPNALVPDPRSLRPCTPHEVERYVHPFDSAARQPTDVVMYLGPDALDRIRADFFSTGTPEWFRGAACADAGQLTTTPSNPNADIPKREGMHVDSEEGYKHRLGVCIRGSRSLLVATHSVERILGLGREATATALRQRFERHPELLGGIGCVHILFNATEAYDAWTGNLVHDGSTLPLNNKDGASGSVSQIAFARL
jgi:hypothetical protein